MRWPHRHNTDIGYAIHANLGIINGLKQDADYLDTQADKLPRSRFADRVHLHAERDAARDLAHQFEELLKRAGA